MRVKVKGTFRYMDGNNARSLQAGVYSVPDQLRESTARLAIEFGAAVIVPEKVAPENKILHVPENKVSDEKKIKRRRKRQWV